MLYDLLEQWTKDGKFTSVISASFLLLGTIPDNFLNQQIYLTL